MINAKYFIEQLKNLDIKFYTGVPDSLMSEFSKSLHFDFNDENHIISTNEGSALATGMGYHLATGKVPLIYLQNSGLGNLVNPYTSLLHKEIYQIPFVLLIGWRGEPGKEDEPQHIFKGRITKKLLKILEIEYIIVNAQSNIEEVLREVKNYLDRNTPIALLLQKNTFQSDERMFVVNKELPKRKDALKTILKKFDKNSLYISTTGKLSRELYELRQKNSEINNDLYTVGGMGHCSAIALGLLQNINNRNIVCLDGDGSVLMHTGNLSLLGSEKYKNFIHILFKNSSHESVGGQPNSYKNINGTKLFKSLGYKKTFSFNNLPDLQNLEIEKFSGPIYIEISVQNSSDKDLMRPDKTPVENKNKFIDKINNESTNC